MTTRLDSILLATRDADRLYRWYAAALPPENGDMQGDYRILDYGGFYLMIDPRKDVATENADPARVILNVGVSDARAAAQRIEEAGTTWVSPLEDRDGSLFATATDPDGNYVQIIQLGAEELATMQANTNGTKPPVGMVLDDAFSGFSVDDLEAAATFYRDVLGLGVQADVSMPLLDLRVGSRRILVYDKGEAHVPATYTVLNLPVLDIERAVRELTERGVQFLRYDGLEQDELGIHRCGGPLIAWFADPAGNVMSVIDGS